MKHYADSDKENDKSEKVMRRRETMWRMAETAQFQRKKLQASSLQVSDPQDAQEQQADSVAKKVVSGQHAPVHAITSSDNVQAKTENDSTDTGAELQNTLSSSKGSGQGLDDATKSDMGEQMGASLEGVRIHTGSNAHAMSENINAKAFTHGQDVYFKQGNYNTHSEEGKELLAHELVHTVQQGTGLSRKIQRHKDDPKVDKLVNQAKPTHSSNEPQLIAYEKGIPIVDSFGGEGNRRISISYLLNEAVLADDPEGKAYTVYLNQIYDIPMKEAADRTAGYLKTKPQLWTYFAATTTIPELVTAGTTPDIYIWHLLGIGPKDAIFLQQYLINVSALSPINALNSTTINDNLKLLAQLSSPDELLSEFDKSNEPKPFDFTEPIANPIQEMIVDETYVAPIDNKIKENAFSQKNLLPFNNEDDTQAFSLPTVDRKQVLVNFVFKHKEINAVLAGNTELKALVAQVLLDRIEERALKENTQDLKPEMYESYLDLQQQTIRSGELYGELNVVRSVYQQYWDHVWEVFHQNQNLFNEIRKISEEKAMYSGDEGRAAYDADFLWDKILAANANDSSFTVLHKEYPDIPFGPMQFRTMWVGTGGSFYYIPPFKFTLPDQEPVETKGLPLLTDRNIADMLMGGYVFTLQDVGKEKGSEVEISLAEQVAAMVTQLETIDATKAAVQKKLVGANYDGTDAIPMPAVLIPETQLDEPVMLTLYLIHTGKNSWKIMDFSIPTQATPTYSAAGATDKEAIANSLANFGQDATYPKGDIIAQGPKEQMGTENRIKVFSTGKNWKEAMSGNLSLISTIAGVLGMILIFTPLAPLGAGLLFVSGVTGATAAGLRIADRIEHETFELNAETMLDVVDIVTGFIVGAKTANAAFKITNQAAKGSKVALLVKGIETGGDVASAVLIGNQFLEEIRRIEQRFQNKEIDEAERDRLVNEQMVLAAGVGLLLLIGYAAPKLKRRFGKTRNQKLQESIEARVNNEINTHIGSPEYLRARQAAWGRYKGKLSRADWDKRYETLIRNKMKGRITEEQFELFNGGERLSRKTKKSWRHIDNFADGVGREVKSGYVKDTKEIRNQIEKDVLLLQDVDSGVRKIEWHFFGGLDPALQTHLDDIVKTLGKDKFNYTVY